MLHGVGSGHLLFPPILFCPIPIISSVQYILGLTNSQPSPTPLTPLSLQICLSLSYHTCILSLPHRPALLTQQRRNGKPLSPSIFLALPLKNGNRPFGLGVRRQSTEILLCCRLLQRYLIISFFLFCPQMYVIGLLRNAETLQSLFFYFVMYA